MRVLSKTVAHKRRVHYISIYIMMFYPVIHSPHVETLKKGRNGNPGWGWDASYKHLPRDSPSRTSYCFSSCIAGLGKIGGRISKKNNGLWMSTSFPSKMEGTQAGNKTTGPRSAGHTVCCFKTVWTLVKSRRLDQEHFVIPMQGKNPFDVAMRASKTTSKNIDYTSTFAHIFACTCFAGLHSAWFHFSPAGGPWPYSNVFLRESRYRHSIAIQTAQSTLPCKNRWVN